MTPEIGQELYSTMLTFILSHFIYGLSFGLCFRLFFVAAERGDIHHD